MVFQENKKNKNKERQGRQSWRKGLLAEYLALIFLKLKGYKILGRRLKTPVGEIDILCQKNKTLIVVEVKYRSTIEAAAHSISRRQMERLSKTVQWIMGSKYSMMKIRFDVLFITPYKIPKHLKNVWSQLKY